MSKHVFVGEETYRLGKELKKWKERFLEKFSEQGLFEFTSENIDKETLQNAILSSGMFTSKKLVIIHGIPRDTISAYKLNKSVAEPVEERLMEVWDRIPEETVLVLVCRKPDKRRKGWKFFSKKADDVKKFGSPRKSTLKKFIEEQTDGIVKSSQASMVIDLVGKNMHNLEHESEKLKLFAQHNKLEKLTDNQITTIVFHQGDIDAFGLLDTLFSDKKASIATVKKMQENNHNEFKTTGMLYYGLKTILQMIDCDKRGINNSKEIAKAIKAPPFAVAKQMKRLKNYRKNEKTITKFFREIMKIDYSIKTGRLPIEGFWGSLKRAIYTLEVN